jgi:hypothetical protein
VERETSWLTACFSVDFAMAKAETGEPAEKNALKSIWRAFDEQTAMVTLGILAFQGG